MDTNQPTDETNPAVPNVNPDVIQQTTPKYLTLPSEAIEVTKSLQGLAPQRSKVMQKFKPEKEGYKIIIDKNGRQRYQKINVDPALTEKRKQSMLAARQKLPEKREYIQEVKRRSYQQQQQLLQTVMDDKKQNELMRQQIQQLIDQSKQLEPLAQRVVERSKSREATHTKQAQSDQVYPTLGGSVRQLGQNIPLRKEPDEVGLRQEGPEQIIKPATQEQQLSEEIVQIIPDKWKQYWGMK